jgi:hypothetical protein
VAALDFNWDPVPRRPETSPPAPLSARTWVRSYSTCLCSNLEHFETYLSLQPLYQYPGPEAGSLKKLGQSELRHNSKDFFHSFSQLWKGCDGALTDQKI